MSSPPKRKKPAPSQAIGRLRYDPYAEEITRPDTVPAALRVGEDWDDEPGSDLEHRRPELPAYSEWRELRNPRDEVTVADISQPTPATAPAPDAGSHHEQRPRPREQVRTLDAPPPVARRRSRRGRLVLLVLLTTGSATALGASMGDGTLKLVVDRVVAAFSEPKSTAPVPLLPTKAPPRIVVSAPRPSPGPSAEANAASAAPVVRFEDLPLAKQNERKTKSKGAAGKLRGRSAR